jgi:50S ribosomal protein L16 3-hydroxylase
MNTNEPSALLGGLSPAAFMRRHWQKKPLLIRQAMPDVVPPADRALLVALAQRDDVESRLVVRDGARWTLRRGPLPRRALPAFARPNWTLLVQGVDRHLDAAHALLSRFRFVPDARLDDLMISYATDGGGVGAHVDSYDVFLLQVHGKRRWKVGRVADITPKPGLPLAILADFRPQHDWLLEPGDMLYLPPGWGHDGEAVGECITCSVGFRTDAALPLADALLQRLADAPPEQGDGARYRDPDQPAVAHPAQLPQGLVDFAVDALRRRLADRREIGHALGTLLSEPHREAVFHATGGTPEGGVRLDRATRMLYDRGALYVNGEHYHAAGRDATLLRRLADTRRLSAAQFAALGEDARGTVEQWMEDGWLHALPPPRTAED